MVQYAVDDIILQEKENKKLSVEDETHDNINDEVGKYDLNEIDKTCLDEKKGRKRAFESKLKIIYDMKKPNGMNCIHDKKSNKTSE